MTWPAVDRPLRAGSPPLRSLLEMLQMYASAFAESLRCLHSTRSFLERPGPNGPKHMGTMVQHCLGSLDQSLGKLPLSRTVRARVERLRAKAAEFDHEWEGAVPDLLKDMEELENDVLIDLRSHLYLAVAESRRDLWEQKEPPFGSRVADYFPEATEDIASASRCLALDEWNAAVFHLMRCLEFGLHDLARQLDLEFSGREFNEVQWGAIIAKAESKLRDMAQPKDGTKKNKKAVEYYSEVTNNFRGFKDAWRNHVTHNHGVSYDENKATRIYESVRHFMRDLASPPDLTGL